MFKDPEVRKVQCDTGLRADWNLGCDCTHEFVGWGQQAKPEGGEGVLDQEGLYIPDSRGFTLSCRNWESFEGCKQGDNKIRNKVQTYSSADSLESGLERDWRQGDQLEDARNSHSA